MAAANMAFQVNCNIERRPYLWNSFDHLKTRLSSVFKPNFIDSQQVPMQFDASKTIKNASVKILDAFVDLVFEFDDQPLLPSQSNFAPVDELKEALLITDIEGKIPDNFPDGVYLRINGSNPLFGGQKSTMSMFGRSSQSWVEGEGMVHALYLNKDSDGSWNVAYNKKHVETETFKLEKQRNKPCFLPATEGDSPAILSAYMLNLVVAENYVPQEIDIGALKTLGNWDVNGAWKRPFTSHPKRDPGTGELVIVGMDAIKPFLELGVISADGKKLVHKVDLKLDRCCIIHEIGITQKYNVILDFPPTIEIKRLFRGGPLIKYGKEDYSRIGIIPRYGESDSIRWSEVETNCTFHVINCFEDDNEVVVWGCRALDAIVPGPGRSLNKFEWFSKRFKPINSIEGDINSSEEDGLLFTRCYEWRLHMKTGEVRERNLTGTEFSMDFPIINGNFTGLKNKYGNTQVVDSIASSTAGMPKYGGLAKLHFEETDTKSSLRKRHSEEQIKVEYHMFEENTFCTGAAFVMKEGSFEEDDGWIITYVHNEDTDISEAYIIDAKKFSSEPVAKITLPCRVPYGFHGAFMPIPKEISAIINL
ncbi:hypothetical protein ACJW30_10G103100 [Castanea mollissima]